MGALARARARIHYLHGEDEDTIVEAAEALLNEGGADAVRLRADIGELGRIEEEFGNPGLFGAGPVHALVRNAQSASPKQGEHLLRLIGRVPENGRLILCAPGVDWKKALHKKLKALDGVQAREFRAPDEQAFARWLAQAAREAGLRLEEDVLAWLAERLCGMRLAARQLIERLRLYDNGAGEPIGMAVVGALLGERAPDDLEEWCHRVAMRDPASVAMARRLLAGGQAAAVQMVSWLGTRMQQLLLYSWAVHRGARDPAREARLFGEARRRAGEEARCWQGRELVAAVRRVVETERLLKGAADFDDMVLIERLTLDLVDRVRLARWQEGG